MKTKKFFKHYSIHLVICFVMTLILMNGYFHNPYADEIINDQISEPAYHSILVKLGENATKYEICKEYFSCQEFYDSLEYEDE